VSGWFEKVIVANRRLVEALLLGQALTVVGLLLAFQLESSANPFLRAWVSQHIPFPAFFLSYYFVAIASGAVVGLTLAAILELESPVRRTSAQPKLITRRPAAVPATVRSTPASTIRIELAPRPAGPFYEKLEMQTLILFVALIAQAVSLWLITISIFRVTDFPADSFYYLRHLPFTYWSGLAMTLALFIVRGKAGGRTRTGLELSTLFLLALYLIGLPSFSYEDPRFLDTYYHEGNSLDMLNFGGWLNSPSWYGHQFPGVFAFFGQLTSVAGIDPFQIMKYYPVALSLLIALFVYSITRMYAPSYASPATGLLLGGLWFQLHISPQSLELLLYLGFLYLMLRVLDDRSLRLQWTALAVSAIPIFVASHPETPLAVGLGISLSLVLSILQSRRNARMILSRIWLPFSFLVYVAFIWWTTIATAAGALVVQTILARALLSLSQLPVGISTQTSSVPSTPAFSYLVTILLEQASSVAVWILGFTLMILLRKMRARELLFGGLFLAAVSTIPLAIFGRVDVLQRSYLFALFPFAILMAWLLERGAVPTLRGRSLLRVYRAVLLILLMGFSVVIPVSRYGVDPFQYINGSSLFVASVATTLAPHSVLFLHPDEDGWRFYAGLQGASSQPRLELKDISGLPGGFVKLASDPTQPPFNLTFSQPDGTADYIFLSNSYQDLYRLRFGANSTYYLNARATFEANVTQEFNLVYSTGTDRLYENRNLP